MQNILKSVFGETKYNNISILIDNIAKHTLLNFEFEIRFIDNNRVSSTLDAYNSIDVTKLKKLSYSDDIVYTVKPEIPLDNSNIKYRMYKSSGKCERKTLISHVTAENQIVNMPIMVKYSIEEDVKLKNPSVSCYQRKQRISYLFNNDKLKNWRLDKTLRLITSDPSSKKLNYDLTEDNVTNPIYYDILDIEFEYIGDNKNILNSLYALFEYIYPKFYSILSKKYVTLENKFKLNFSNIFPKISIITNNIINNQSIEDYVIMEKLDGERRALIKYKKYIFELTSTSFTEIYKDPTKVKKNKLEKICNSYSATKRKSISNNLCIVDSEYIDGVYYLFDILYYNSQNVNNQTYTDRYEFLKCFIKEIDSIIDVKLIPYKKVNNWNDIVSKIENMYKSEIFDNIYIDGVICRTNNSSFINSVAYKLKSKKLSTIDFKLFWVEEKQCYYLYLIGNTDCVFKKICFLNKYSKQHVNNSLLETSNKKNIYILFSSVYRDDMHMYKPNTNVDLNQFVNKSIIDNTKFIINDMIKNPLNYNGVIVEMSFYDNKWIPIKVRKDKLFSNNYKVGNSIDSLLFDKLKLKESNNRKISINKENIILYQSIYGTMNKYIIEVLLNKLSHINILYIFDGCNNSKELFKCADIDTMYALNANKYNLIQFTENMQNVKNNDDKRLLISSSNIYNNQILDLNCIQKNIGDVNDNIINSLLHKPYYIQRSINVVLCERFDKVCSSYSQIIDFKNTIEEIINNNGLFIITFLDGYSILNSKSEYYTKVERLYDIKYSKFLEDNFDIDIVKGLYHVLNVNYIYENYDNACFNETNMVNTVCITQNDIMNNVIANVSIDSDIKTFTNDNNEEYCVKITNRIYMYVLDCDFKLYVNYNSNYSNEDIMFLHNKVLNVISENTVLNEFELYNIPNIYKLKNSVRNLVTFDHLNVLETSFNKETLIEPLTATEVSRYIAVNNRYKNITQLQDYTQLFKCIYFTTKSKI